MTKSFALWSVSSPFPEFDSAPDIDSLVDEVVAFRSKLTPVLAVANADVSKSTTAPNPTLSTTVVPASE